MATLDLDQRMLGRLAKAAAPLEPMLSSQLYKILGLSVMLRRHLVRARALFNVDRSSLGERALALIHQIVFLAREGLSLTETQIFPRIKHGQASAELEIFAAKLQASFYHIVCLYHNSPPVKPIQDVSHLSSQTIAPGTKSSPLVQRFGSPRQVRTFTPTRPLDSSIFNTPANLSELEGANPTYHLSSSPAPPDRQPHLRDAIPSVVSDVSNVTNPIQAHRLSIPPAGERRTQHLRDTIPSILSDASFVTNPFDSQRQSIPAPANPGNRSDRKQSHLRDTIPSLLSDASYVTNPYAALPPRTPPPPLLPPLPNSSSPSRFLLPRLDYIPGTMHLFKRASILTRTHLSGSAPLRLSIACEYAIFLRDCLGDWEHGMEVARAAVRDSHNASDAMSDEDFRDASSLVVHLKQLAQGHESTWPALGSETPHPHPQPQPASARGPPSSSPALSPTGPVPQMPLPPLLELQQLNASALGGLVMDSAEAGRAGWTLPTEPEMRVVPAVSAGAWWGTVGPAVGG